MKTLFPIAPAGNAKRSRAGWTLVEMLVALFCGMIILASLTAVTVFASRSYLAIANYRDLDNNSRNALDVMSRDIRSMAVVTSYSSSAISLSNIDGSTVTFSWNPAATTFTRTYTPAGGTATTSTLLTNCTILVFQVYSQVPTNSFQFPSTDSNPSETKLIDVSWRCARSILGGAETNSESVQTAKIVIRNHS
ncbi:MAG TPA: prepilin-type N-terminal cleavage/methylation domain-containing protein [Verrucomicrobiae bacterium]|nr:prepilin-type N-terminal cleavage/methylation domain-containing protein [Verrucomicrobiae bacterium]